MRSERSERLGRDARDATVSLTSADATSAGQIALDAGSATQLEGLITQPLPASFELTRAAPELRASIEGLPTRTLKLTGSVTTPGAAACPVTHLFSD